jgi:uncharacterized protein (TIGR02246 family)
MRRLVHLAVLITIVTAALSPPVSAAPPAAKSEAEIRQLLTRWQKAFRAKDIDAVMAVYASGVTVVAFDVVPPLEKVGKESYRKNYEEFFAMYEGSPDVEVRDLRIVAGKDVAFIYCLERMSGTLKGGQRSDIWLRVTSGLRKIAGKWLIVHDHVSVPADFETGKAALDLKP